MTKAPQVIAIVGPTASGKSSLADRVALALGSSVVSVDAMQVYRGMDVGTAKTPVDERRVPLLMVDVADVTEDYSVKLFQAEARRLIDDMLSQGLTPVLCGGTGLYLDAVIDEMDFPTGEKGGEGRSRYEAYAEEHGEDALHALLAERDPASAEVIHPHNVRRVVRALEMADEGVSYAEQKEHLTKRAPHYETAIWAIQMDRRRLYERIDTRVDTMFDQGLVSEVSALKEQGLDLSHTAGQAIGYKEVLQALDGEITLDEARTLIKKRSRNYAKRQLSWLRRDGRAHWIDVEHTSEDEAVGLIIAGIRDGRMQKGIA